MNNSLFPAFGVLVVDDEAAWLRSISLILERFAGVNNVRVCQDSRQVMEIISHHDIGIVLLDLTMPNLSGEELLTRISESHPEIVTIIISGMNQVEKAVECMKLGAFDYFVKTVEEQRLLSGITRAIRMVELQRENQEMGKSLVSVGLRNPEVFKDIVTVDPAMHAVFAYVEAVAKSPQPLMIRGESGVGKELLAKAAHVLSGCQGPLVAVNVAGVDDNVFADTLFGHVRGAYTGAEQPRRGMIEEAADGTLFLDEIGDLSMQSQVKLLRLLQEGEYFPLGSDRPKRMRARVIVATHADLVSKEANGQFRRDLYYRLRTHCVEIAPLRRRKGDLRVLIEHFVAEAARSLGKPRLAIPREVLMALFSYAFPGNVRELRSMVYDAVSVARDKVLPVENFLKAMGESVVEQLPSAPAQDSANVFNSFDRLPTFGDVAEMLVDEALKRGGGNQTIAARLLGISQPALSKRLKMRRQI